MCSSLGVSPIDDHLGDWASGDRGWDVCFPPLSTAHGSLQLASRRDQSSLSVWRRVIETYIDATLKALFDHSFAERVSWRVVFILESLSTPQSTHRRKAAPSRDLSQNQSTRQAFLDQPTTFWVSRPARLFPLPCSSQPCFISLLTVRDQKGLRQDPCQSCLASFSSDHL